MMVKCVFAREEKGMQFPMHWAREVYFYCGVRFRPRRMCHPRAL